MPKDTQVLSVKVNNNIATVDFNKAFKTNFTGGSTGGIDVDWLYCKFFNRIQRYKSSSLYC